MPNTIILKGDLAERYEEAPAEAGLYPGHFLEKTSTGTVQKNATAGSDKPLRIAIEDALQGKTINQAYAAADVVRYFDPQPGDVVYARVAAGHAAIAIDAVLKLQNDGTVVAQGGTGAVKCVAEEAVDNSGGGAEAFIKVRIK